MSRSIFPGVTATLALAVSALQPNFCTAQDPISPKISLALVPIFKEAQKAQRDQRWPEVIVLAKQALATSNRKPDDTYYAYYLLYSAHVASRDRPSARDDLQGMIDANFLSQEHRATLVRAIEAMDAQGPKN